MPFIWHLYGIYAVFLSSGLPVRSKLTAIRFDFCTRRQGLRGNASFRVSQKNPSYMRPAFSFETFGLARRQAAKADWTVIKSLPLCKAGNQEDQCFSRAPSWRRGSVFFWVRAFIPEAIRLPDVWALLAFPSVPHPLNQPFAQVRSENPGIPCPEEELSDSSAPLSQSVGSVPSSDSPPGLSPPGS